MKIKISPNKKASVKKADLDNWYDECLLDLEEANLGVPGGKVFVISWNLTTTNDTANGLQFLMTPEDARSLARELVQLADEVEQG